MPRAGAMRHAHGQSAVFSSDHKGAGLSPPLDTKNLVEADGIEPTTSCLQSTRSPN